MSGLLEWVVKYGDSLSVVSVLLIVLGVIVIGLYKRWWVPGWMYTDCTDERDKLQKAVDDETERMRIRISVLEQPPTRRRTSQ